MAVVLLAMGGYGSYLGWQIRTSEDGVRAACHRMLLFDRSSSIACCFWTVAAA
jgi:hypothetical protein